MKKNVIRKSKSKKRAEAVEQAKLGEKGENQKRKIGEGNNENKLKIEGNKAQRKK